MSNKLCLLGLTLTLSLLIVSGCATPTAEPVGPSAGEGEYCVDQATGAKMSYEEAVEIAEGSECVVQGGLKETRFCNEDTGTWWIDLDIEKPGCMPACVIKVSDKTAEINWRCTGAVPPEDTAAVLDPARARDAALDYIFDRYGEVVFPPPGSDWTEENVTGEGLVGASTFRYTAADLVVTVSFPVVNPADTIYQVVVSKEGTGFRWEGEVDAAGQVTEISTSDAQLPVTAWYGYVASTPTGAQFDDYLVLMPEGIGEIGVEGADEAVEAQIVALRDRSEPGKYANFWGHLTCDVLDYGGCQLLVTRLRVDGPGPFFPPDPVEGWEGTLVSGPPGPRSGGDDYFLLAGDFSVQYGVDSVDPVIAAQLGSLRDTGTVFRVWGELSAGVIDWNASQIQVTRIEVVGEPTVPTPIVEQPIVGWLGYIISLPTGAQYDDYFQREDGQRYGIEGVSDDMQRRLEAIQTTGTQVRVWGRLVSDIPDYEARQIRVERYELATETETVDRRGLSRLQV